MKILFSKDSQGKIAVDKNDVTSGLTGLSLGVSYQQNSAKFSVTDNMINFTVIGTQSYNIFWQGFGTIQSVNVTIRGAYNTNTGAYTISVGR